MIPPAFKDAREGVAKESRPRREAIHVQIIDADELPRHVDAWLDLISAAAVSNPSYHPNMLLPEIRSFERRGRLRILLVFGGSERGQSLWGLFPLEIQRPRFPVPVRVLSFWRHRRCALAVPLIREGRLWEVLDAFWRWFERNPFGCRILDTNDLLAEGGFHATWSSLLLGRSSFMTGERSRQVWRGRYMTRRTFVSDGSRWGDLWVSALPLLRCGARQQNISSLAPASWASPTVRVVEASELERYIDQWTALSAATVVPNVFYEPWMLLPAIESPGDAANLRFALVFGPKDGVSQEPLWGFFPMQLQTTSMHLPVRSLAFWQHDRYFSLSVPLIRGDHVPEVLSAFWAWFEGAPFGCCLLDTNDLPADGPFHALWADAIDGRPAHVVVDFPRAFFEPSESAESYVKRAISKKHRHNLERFERRLGELGKLEYRQATTPEDVEHWLDEFLELEAAGWKGAPADSALALAKDAAHTSYFRRITRDGCSRKQIMLLTLTLDGRPIAMKHNILTGNGGFAYKIAYDERYAKYSPGSLLELDNIRRVCDSRTQWLDSCAHPRHALMGHLWRERRMIRRTIVSNGSPWGDLVVSWVPLLRWFGRFAIAPRRRVHWEVSTRVITTLSDRASSASTFASGKPSLKPAFFKSVS